MTIAVEDSGCVVKIPQAKANYFGIGYDPAVENPEISAYRNTVNQRGVGQGVYRMDALIPAASSGSRNSSDLLRNKGVGGFSLNDDEDDVYDNNNHDENSGRDGYTLQLSNKCRESDSDNEEQSFGNKARVKAKELTASVDKWLGSSVGETSVGDSLITRSTSAIAVCRSSASRVSLNKRTFSMATTAWSAKDWASATSATLKALAVTRIKTRTPIGSCPAPRNSGTISDALQPRARRISCSCAGRSI